jgi:oxygen-independent coproporphyrinogen III oxidase
MAGIYIHIPFCRKACHYCNFHFSTSLTLKNDFVTALLKEIDLQQSFLGQATIDTVYFGGGTPSLLPIEDLNAIMNKIRSKFSVNTMAEVTLEANPDDISSKIITEWKGTGINRLSIGVQSFFDEDLKWMNRAHDASQARRCILAAQENGITNLSIDLIYGTPTLTDENWESNLEQAIKLNIPHLSCYALTVEPKTALHAMIAKHRVKDINQDDQARQFMMLLDRMEAAGYENYEISNFALPGMRSKHNSSYWKGVPYLGLGPSAHSYNHGSRQWNVSNNAIYIQSLANGTVPFEHEVLTVSQQLNEYIMTASRTVEGIDLNFVREKYGETVLNELVENSRSYINEGMMQLKNEHLVLAKKGKLFADGIAAALFFDNVLA